MTDSVPARVLGKQIERAVALLGTDTVAMQLRAWIGALETTPEGAQAYFASTTISPVSPRGCVKWVRS